MGNGSGKEGSGGCVLISLSNMDRSKRSHGELSFSAMFDNILNTNSEVILLLQAWLDKGLHVLHELDSLLLALSYSETNLLCGVITSTYLGGGRGDFPFPSLWPGSPLYLVGWLG